LKNVCPLGSGRLVTMPTLRAKVVLEIQLTDGVATGVIAHSTSTPRFLIEPPLRMSTS
jgi:hypothetical protein